MNRLQKNIIKNAIDQPDKLSDWENDFINNVAIQDDDYELTEKQNSIINKISRKLL